MIKKYEECYVIHCDRCGERIDQFQNEKTKELLDSSLIQLCDNCKETFTEKHIAAIRMRLKTGVIYATLSSSNDQEVERLITN